jgi:methionyl-tRNA formyltransferase
LAFNYREVKAMRIVYIGAERVGLACLKKLIELEKNVVAALTYDDDLKPVVADFAPFDELSKQALIPLIKIKNSKDPGTIQLIGSYEPDLILVVSWSQIIPKEIIDLAPQGCLGIHYSLLPQRRGGAPLNWAIIDGLTRSGITLFFLDEGVDSGDIVAQKEFEIAETDTPKELLDKICVLAPQIIEENIEAIESGNVKPTKQSEAKATYTHRRKPEDGLIDWNKTTKEIYNFIRALAPPYPGAFTYLGNRKLTIPRARLKEGRLDIEGYITE